MHAAATTARAIGRSDRDGFRDMRFLYPPRAAYRATLLLGVTVPIVASVYALWRLHGGWVSWRDIGLFAGMYLATGLGTTLGYHRLVAHGSFSTGPLVKG